MCLPELFWREKSAIGELGVQHSTDGYRAPSPRN